ncbi:MAG: hypothetical protein OIF38_10860 [Cellvibrionaceae bacterium]|nr:hypothetical protein [Cellvibrionaceae bacterium]
MIRLFIASTVLLLCLASPGHCTQTAAAASDSADQDSAQASTITAPKATATAHNNAEPEPSPKAEPSLEPKSKPAVLGVSRESVSREHSDGKDSAAKRSKAAQQALRQSKGKILKLQRGQGGYTVKVLTNSGKVRNIWVAD